MVKRIFALAAGAALLSSTAMAQINWTEDFESYANTAAVEAVWTASQTGVITLTTLAGDGAQGGNKYMSVPSATAGTLSRVIGQTGFVGDASPVVLTAYVRAADYTNSRVGLSMRDAALGTAFYAHIGTSNGLVQPGNVAAGNKWASRIFGYSGLPSGNYWGYFNSANRVTGAWVKLELICGRTTVKAEFDDVNTPADDITGLVSTGTAVGSCRISYGSSPNVNYDIDNISIVGGSAVAAVSDWNMIID
ncbi:hypothetical protein BH09SUM1_BH09SUM1_24550 [soil metagenome]